jgi:hypothetical protein
MNEAIAPNYPEYSGAVTSWSVTPDLPVGLHLHPVQGYIYGTPTILQEAVLHTVVAGNEYGITSTVISITVNRNPVVSISDIPGVTAPVVGAIPVTTITETAQYTGTVSWDGEWSWSKRFAGRKAYTATIRLTVKHGYTLKGVPANFFRVAEARSVTNSENSSIITALFPATASVGTIGDSALGGKVAYILKSGDPGYNPHEQRGLIAATWDQSSGLGIIWAVGTGQYTSVPNGTKVELGTGSVNTDRIIAQNGAGDTYAAGLARAYNGGGYTDWYLPSKDELNKLHLNRVAIGNFSEDSYWSSSESKTSDKWVWHQHLPSGITNSNYKLTQYRVRAVRTF